MNISQIENKIANLILEINKETFIYDLLTAYGVPKASISRLKNGSLNLSKNNGEIIWKKKIFFKENISKDCNQEFEDLIINKNSVKHAPRFIIVSDYLKIIAIDTKTNEKIDIPINQLNKQFDFFLPLAGMEKAQLLLENPADVKAADKMGKLYDEIKKDNSPANESEIHELNVFFTRILFCFFAEDTNIFQDGQFTGGISSHTQLDGSDLNSYFERLFIVFNTPKDERGNIPDYLDAYPYVNGSLFNSTLRIPNFSRKSRQIIIESGQLDWSAINPDIFGSMIQAVITPEHRGGLGMHYTSVPNIMKVIEPLFLNELNEEFERSKHEPKRLYILLERLGKIKIFDPACGSGNFLIIAYKEFRLLEIKILNQLKELQSIVSGFEPKQLELIPKQQLSLAASFQLQMFSRVELSQFFGIELDDFAHEVAILSLWLAQHQMNLRFKEIFGSGNPTLPLQNGGNIFHGNATRLKWSEVCPKNEGDEIYILGNPPYLGARLQNEMQKQDMEFVFGEITGFNNLDYIASWILLSKKYISNFNSRVGFVTTNSICQGTQVPILWPNIVDGVTEIGFIHQSFKWKNNAKSNAGVSVMVIGLRNNSNQPKYIINENLKIKVKNINGYGIDSDNIYILDRKNSISRLPPMTYGSMPNEDGELLLNEYEFKELIKIYINLNKFTKYFIGADELMNGVKKYCLWIEDEDLDEALTIPFIQNRVENVRKYRLKSKRKATNKLSTKSHRFGEIRHINGPSIIVPQTGSERREYLPVDFRDGNSVVSNAARVVYNAQPFIFSVLVSKMHMIWVRAVSGRLKMDMQYSNTLCYNTFPFPFISESQKGELGKMGFDILESREKHSEKTLSQLYDPIKMPEGLKYAHHQLDLAIESCYRPRPFDTDEERLEYLFKLYEQMMEDEKSKGTLFEDQAKPKKKKK